jgi:hypothetical protein
VGTDLNTPRNEQETDMRRTLLIVATALATAAMLVPAAAQARGAHHRTAATADRNRDRIPDRWERRYRLSLRVKQTRRDQDHDGLNNLGEFRSKTNPRDDDSDNDGVEDGDERSHGLNARDDDSDDDGVEDGDENAGKVLTFTGGRLTIELTNGDTVSGLVNGDTEIECEHAKSTATASSRDDDGDENEADDDNERGDGEQGDDEDGNNEGDENDEDDEGACSQSDLVLNAIVHEAELKATSAGAVFEEVELVK